MALIDAYEPSHVCLRGGSSFELWPFTASVAWGGNPRPQGAVSGRQSQGTGALSRYGQEGPGAVYSLHVSDGSDAVDPYL